MVSNPVPRRRETPRTAEWLFDAAPKASDAGLRPLAEETVPAKNVGSHRLLANDAIREDDETGCVHHIGAIWRHAATHVQDPSELDAVFRGSSPELSGQASLVVNAGPSLEPRASRVGPCSSPLTTPAPVSSLLPWEEVNVEGVDTTLKEPTQECTGRHSHPVEPARRVCVAEAQYVIPGPQEKCRSRAEGAAYEAMQAMCKAMPELSHGLVVKDAPQLAHTTLEAEPKARVTAPYSTC